SEYQRLAKEHAELLAIVDTFRSYRSVLQQIQESRTLLRSEKDQEVRDLAQEEIELLTFRQRELEDRLKAMLTPKDPHDHKNIFLEIRAGTGGEEAGLFAADLFRMYSKFAERRGWRVEVVDSHPTGVGGLKEVIALVEGKGAYSHLKFESGVHRVQRVPVTESQGRIHTSAVTVAVLPEAEDVEVHIDPSDLRVDVFRSSGPGGQSVNTTDSAVRITHLPTGVVVTCQDEKSQHKNKAKALRVLKARLLDQMREEQRKAISQQRRIQVGSGDRSERIRTYNFPQGRVTDHRIGLTIYRLPEVLEGDLDEIIASLQDHYNAEALKEGSS
ncbi:MAG: peptide chain release factor 1, partial [Thermodesulfobacteriota bacterium]